LLRHKEILDVPLGELIGGDPVIGGQLTNSAEILTLGASKFCLALTSFSICI